MTDRRCPRFVVALVGVIVALSMSEGAAHAAAPIAPMTVAVSLEGDGPRWHLDAWAGSLRYHLDRASQLRVVEADVPSGCAPRPSCLLDAWAGSADLLAVGNAHGDGLALSLWSVSGHRRLSQVRVDTDRGSPDEQLRRAAVALSRPLQLATRPVTAPDEAEAATVRSASSLIIDVLGALLALLLVAVAGERRPTVAVLAAAFGALALLRGHPAGDLVVGALWGWWLVDVLPSLVAPAPRLDRAPGRLLARAVGALLSESALRLVGTLLFDGVVLLAVALLARLLGLSWRETVTGPALLAALLCRQALKTLPRRLAGALDHELEARRQASAGYHRAVMRTLRAHFRRHGLDEALERLENVSILVVDGDDVVGYGDRAQVRLRVGRELLSAAGVKPAADRHVSLRVDARWSAGLIVPRPPSSSAAASPLGVGDAAYEPRRARRFLDRSAEVRGYQAPLDGWVLPRRGEARPLLADTAADHAIVDALVRAPLLRFGRPGVDDDHDDSDPGHRDFLVGALLREILRVQCASPLNGPTVALWLARSRLAPIWARARALVDPAVNQQAAYPDLLVALHRGRDALMQDLARRLSLPVELTARANAPLLMRRSLDVLAALSTLEGSPSSRPDARRLARLGRLLDDASAPAPRRWALLATAAVAVAALAAATVDAVRYHPRYEALMAAEQARLTSPSPADAPEGGVPREGAADDAR
jgi:hypothetical protein